MSGAEELTIVHEFEKPRATVRAYINEFHGKRYAHIREFVEPRDQPGAALIATKAGICVAVDDLSELEAAIGALRAATGPLEAGASQRKVRSERHGPVST